MTNSSLDSRWPSGFLSEESPTPSAPQRQRPRLRRGFLLSLFFLTLLSATWVGTTGWSPSDLLFESLANQTLLYVRAMILENGGCAVAFGMSLIGILLAHELGHYLMTRIYRVPATPPIFIPFPFNPIGTCGALIAMQGGVADRKQMFDIGIAGPLAGLVIAIPVMLAGFYTDLHPNTFLNTIPIRFGQPLIMELLVDWLKIDALQSESAMLNTRMNPFIMAAWAGLLITGLNMMPMSQLDGGHVAFGLLGNRSVYLAYLAFGGSVAYMVFYQQYAFALMLGLVLLMGLRHPPSSDDTVPLGLGRHILGWMSLSLPILCIPATLFTLF